MSFESDNTVKSVQQILNFESDHGTEKAYEKLRSDFEKYTTSHDGNQSKSYWDSVQRGLGPTALPDLAVVWGQNNRERFPGGTIEQNVLKTVPLMQISDFDRTMSVQLSNQFDSLKNVHYDRGPGGDELNAISKGDLADRLGQIDAARVNGMRQRSETAKTADLMFQLTANSDGSMNSTLFNRLANHDGTVSHKIAAAFGATPEGAIGKKELDNAVADYDRRKSLGEIDQLPREMRQRVEADAATARYLKDNWDRPEVQQMRTFTETIDHNGRDSGPGKTVRHYWSITPESLAAAGGFKDMNEALSRFKGSYAVKEDEAPAPAVQREAARPAQEARQSDSDAAAQAALTREAGRQRALVDHMMRDSIQKNGEGPFQAAARLLPEGNPSELMTLTRALKRSYQEQSHDMSNDLKKLPTGYQWLNAENLNDIFYHSPALKERFRVMLQPQS